MNSEAHRRVLVEGCVFESLACGCKIGKLSGKVRSEEAYATRTSGLTGQSSGGRAEE